jgi:hypothetical protein
MMIQNTKGNQNRLARAYERVYEARWEGVVAEVNAILSEQVVHCPVDEVAQPAPLPDTGPVVIEFTDGTVDVRSTDWLVQFANTSVHDTVARWCRPGETWCPLERIRVRRWTAETIPAPGRRYLAFAEGDDCWVATDGDLSPAARVAIWNRTGRGFPFAWQYVDDVVLR